MAKERSELTMAWTIACYCGNVYSAPPDRCEICGSTLEPSASNGADADNYRQPAALAGGRRTGRIRGAGYSEPWTRTALRPRMARRQLAGIRIDSL
jgi:hypothetical protein